MNKTKHDLRMLFDSEYAAKQKGIERLRKVLLEEMINEYKSHHHLIYFAIILQAIIVIMDPNNVINVIAITLNLLIFIVSPLITFLLNYIHYRKKILKL